MVSFSVRLAGHQPNKTQSPPGCEIHLMIRSKYGVVKAFQMYVL